MMLMQERHVLEVQPDSAANAARHINNLFVQWMRSKDVPGLCMGGGRATAAKSEYNSQLARGASPGRCMKTQPRRPPAAPLATSAAAPAAPVAVS